MRKAFKKLWNDDRGNVIAIVAACLPLVVGAAGLASDTIQWTLWKRQLQRAADSAAIAGVYDRQANAGATSGTSDAVAHDLTLNRHMWMALKSGFPEVTFPTNSGVQLYQVQVRLAVQQRLPFSALFLTSAPTITATARAASIPSGGDACIEALDTSTATGITFNGNAAIYMPDCDAFSNSAGTNSSVAKGSSQVTANSIGGVGGIQQSNNFQVGSYRPYSPPLPDPFENVNPAPSDMVCGSGANATITDNTNFGSLGGVNCFSSLSVGPNKTLNIPDNFGPIYINGGGADIKGNINCVGCTIVLTNRDAASPIGNITVNATAELNLSAPTSGPFKGIAIFQDRRATDCNNCNKVNGNSMSVITGALYFPKQELQYNGTGNTTATCTMFVAKRISFIGNSGVSNKFKKLADCSSAGLPSSATVRIVRLVG